MRIEALEYQADKKEDIIIFVDYNEVYNEGYHVQQSIADIAYRKSPSRGYIFSSDTYRDNSEYYILFPGEKIAYALKRQKEFAGEIKLREALASTWNIIRPGMDPILGMWEGGNLETYLIQNKRGNATTTLPRSLLSASDGARLQLVKVRNLPGNGKDVAEGRGVHREVRSEGSRMWGTYQPMGRSLV